jgi:predicted aldo/keto reductase-like oxidoreductase
MRYRKDRYGNELSQLGYGCMRFTKKGTQIDYEKAEREVLHAIENGINYYDTAYVYPGSEECLGRILAENGMRDKVNIATKLPQYMIRSAKGIDKTFSEELSRLRTDHIDYYLMHAQDKANFEKYKSCRAYETALELLAEGKIRHFGISFHDTAEVLDKILTEQPQLGDVELYYADDEGKDVFVVVGMEGPLGSLEIPEELYRETVDNFGSQMADLRARKDLIVDEKWAMEVIKAVSAPGSRS